MFLILSSFNPRWQATLVLISWQHAEAPNNKATNAPQTVFFIERLHD